MFQAKIKILESFPTLKGFSRQLSGVTIRCGFFFFGYCVIKMSLFGRYMKPSKSLFSKRPMCDVKNHGWVKDGSKCQTDGWLLV